MTTVAEAFRNHEDHRQESRVSSAIQCKCELKGDLGADKLGGKCTHEIGLIQAERPGTSRSKKGTLLQKNTAVRIASYLLGIRPKGPLLEHLQKNDLRNPPCQVCPPTKQHNLPGGEFPIH